MSSIYVYIYEYWNIGILFIIISKYLYIYYFKYTEFVETDSFYNKIGKSNI